MTISKNHRKLSLCFVLLFSIGSYSNFSYANWYKHNDSLMGSNIAIEFWIDDANLADGIMRETLSILRNIDEQMSTYKENSELSHINQFAFTEDVIISENLFHLIERALGFSKISHGAFDITYASVGFLYNYREKIKPSENEIRVRLSAIDYQSIILNKQKHSIRFTKKLTKIDLGGIAKGYAVDLAISFLKSKNIQNALVTAGGDTRLLGDNRGRPWIVGIKKPRNLKVSSLLIPLENIAISTSGDYERFFIDEKDNTRYHHIINPKTGHSPNGDVESVSILASDATTTDGLSTTVFVLGLEKGMELINQMTGVDAIIITSGNQIFYSKGLQQLK